MSGFDVETYHEKGASLTAETGAKLLELATEFIAQSSKYPLGE